MRLTLLTSSCNLVAPPHKRPWLALGRGGRAAGPLPNAAAAAAAAAARRRAPLCRASTARAVTSQEAGPAVDAAADESLPQPRQRLCEAEQESLELLEWPALCRQVACFTQTAIGAEMALDCRLPVGRSVGESERLLQETQEAQQAGLT